MASLLAELKEKNLIQDVTNFEELDRYLESGPRVVYAGFDPTADSLHVGNLVPILMLKKFQQHGHRPIVLVGGATGMIGDPSFKDDERQLLDAATVEKNCLGLEKVLGKYLEQNGPNGYIMVRNDAWYKQMNCLDFLRDIGKHFSVNAMISKESVRRRLEDRDQGISYTEFSYALLQAYDYYHLNKTYNCTVEIGGSDQWGNITAGVELIRRKSVGTINVHGISFPLITTAAGKKFGKSEGNAIWLSKENTSPYEFYQFWINIADEDIERMLTIYSDFSLAEIKSQLAEAHKQPEARMAQKTLARLITELTHGAEETQKAIKASEVLFGGSIEGLDSSLLLAIFKNVPATSVAKSQIETGLGLLDLLVITRLASSKSAAKRLIEGGGLYLNSVKISDLNKVISLSDFIDNCVLVLRSGKRNYHLVTSN